MRSRVLAFVAAALGCSGSETAALDAPMVTIDAPRGADAAAVRDAAGARDAAVRDAAGARDAAGVRDAPGTPDAAAARDARVVDAAALDAGTVRAGPGVRPDGVNTGVPPGVTLTVVNDDVDVTIDNTTIDAQDIHGFLTIHASHVRVTRSVVRGHAVTGNASVIRVASGSDILIEDSEIAVAVPSAGVDGMSGSGFVARRMNIHGGVDGMKLGSSTTVEYSYVHGLSSFASDPNQGGGPTHNDAIQILAGTGIHILGNSLVAATNQNAAIQITQDFGVVSDVHIEGNFADGGGCTFNFSHNGEDSLGQLFTVGNRFGRGSFFDCPILKSTQTTLSTTGDVWDDDGTPVPVQTHD